ncbi:hypothetical protein BRCON_1993 [Candidatus Sumerlaea chitinivorans]|uniref:Uncharacterized protein n=1 Tax=Sumerlaea chitinivorans TaxID=2250252 RepID=A0A2Z4Y6D9_SUMC1|nr:hypothetical protein BRCON_1993 [Candidatus Sumerlaea chitinivorans]
MRSLEATKVREANAWAFLQARIEKVLRHVLNSGACPS